MDVNLIQNHEFLSKEPRLDFDFDFEGFGKCKSKCNIKVWTIQEKQFVLLTDLGVGTSVTNASEIIITKLYREVFRLYHKEDLIFAEMYTEDREEDIDLIIPTWIHDKVTNVEWKNIGKIKIDKNENRRSSTKSN